MDDKVVKQCSILVSSKQHWDPLRALLNEMMGVEINKLVYADTIEKIKEIQGTIKLIRRLLALPEEINRL